MSETCSICFDCANAYAHRCRKILDGTPIEGWTAEELPGGGYQVLACPGFQRDRNRNHQITVKDLARLLGISMRTIYRMEPHKLIERVRKKGYQLKIHADKTKRIYYIYKV